MTPFGAFRTAKGELTPGGVSIRAVAERAGTPFYIYDAAVMRRQYARLSGAMPSAVSIHFSVKSNPNICVARVFKNIGAGVEVASEGELRLAFDAGFAPEKIIFAGPGKNEKEIRLAVRKRIGCINVESEAELDRVLNCVGSRRGSKTANPARIAFRINPSFGVHGETIMIGGPRKFGLDDDVVERVARKALSDGRLDVMGFHCFAGTQILNWRTLTGVYEGFARWAVESAGRLDFNVRLLNFGGGLGISFSDKEQELDVDALGAGMKRITARLARSSHFRAAKFIVEPGRYLTGPSGVYVSAVTDIKTSRGVEYVITDGGIHHALLPIALNKNYPTAIVNKMNRKPAGEYVIAGPLCASPDQFSRKTLLPQPQIGDLVGVFNSGAYGYSAGMLFFLSRKTPAEVLVDDGKAWIIRKPFRPGHGLDKPVRCG
jgi:diaminopimelate decarboxylase